MDERKAKGMRARGVQAGFTLIEVLTVIGIISLLMGAIIVVAAGLPEKARRNGTMGLLQQLSQALNSYYQEFRAYPPDGYDGAVLAPNGLRLRGSACLTYFLAWKYPSEDGEFVSFDLQKADFTDPERVRMVKAHAGEPYWADVKPRENLNQHGEILDRWRNPMRYDNCERTAEGKILYSPGLQPAAEARDPDPRERRNSGRPFNPGSYDLWSCGSDGNSDNPDVKDDLVSGREEVK